MLMTAYHATTMGCNKIKYSFHLLINCLKKKKRKKDDSNKNQIKSNIIKKVDHNKSAKAIEWNETESGSKWIKALIASKQTHEHTHTPLTFKSNQMVRTSTIYLFYPFFMHLLRCDWNFTTNSKFNALLLLHVWVTEWVSECMTDDMTILPSVLIYFTF